MAVGAFATAINCIDGRVQRPVSEWIRINFAVDYVDTVTCPGPDKVLTQGPENVVALLRQNVEISVSAHHSALIAVAAHADCAGNPVSDDEHKAHVRAACQHIAGWGFPVRIIGLWVNEWWQVEQIADTQESTVSRR